MTKAKESAGAKEKAPAKENAAPAKSSAAKDSAKTESAKDSAAKESAADAKDKMSSGDAAADVSVVPNDQVENAAHNSDVETNKAANSEKGDDRTPDFDRLKKSADDKQSEVSGKAKEAQEKSASEDDEGKPEDVKLREEAENSVWTDKKAEDVTHNLEALRASEPGTPEDQIGLPGWAKTENLPDTGTPEGRKMLRGTRLKIGSDDVVLEQDTIVSYPNHADEQKFVGMMHNSGNDKFRGELRFRYNGLGARLPLSEQVDDPSEMPEFIKGLTETEAASFGITLEDWKHAKNS